MLCARGRLEQQLDLLPNQFFFTVPKPELGLPVDLPDDAVVVDHENRERSTLDDFHDLIIRGLAVMNIHA